MKNFINSIHSYHLFNYLVPGVVYAFIISNLSSNIDLIPDDVLKAIFLYYFIGLVISRIGSLIIEPLLLKIKIYKKYDFNDYVIGSSVDSNIGLLLETANMYRGLISMVLCIFITLICDKIQSYLEWDEKIVFIILLFALLILFVVAFIKQNTYIKRRLKVLKDKDFKVE